MSFAHPTIVRLLATQWSEPDDGSRVWATYGITEAVRLQIVALQAGRCCICKESRELVVDHDHTTNRVRGLICVRCNATLGAAGDSRRRLRAKAARLIRTAQYLDHAARRGDGVGDESSWRAIRAAQVEQARALRAARASARPVSQAPPPDVEEVAPPPPAAPSVPAYDLLARWPPELVRTFPARNVSRPHRPGRLHWAMWCPIGLADRQIEEIRGGMDASWRHMHVEDRRAVTETADAMTLEELDGKQTVALYVMAFMREVTESVERALDGSRGYEITEPILRAASEMLPDDKSPYWHWRAATVLPMGPDLAECRSAASLGTTEAIVDLAWSYWKQTLEQWAIVSVSETRQEAVA
jgi:Recombination endonuclease VII